MTHISGQDFDVLIGDLLIHVENLTATISDNSKMAMTRGIPSGRINGDVSCTGDIEVDLKNFNLIIDAARSAGSFRELDEFDIICIAKAGNDESKFELFGCLLTISDLLNIEANGSDKSRNKITFDVTSTDFVRINGVPYLSDNDIRDL